MSTNTKLTIKSRSYADDKKTVSNTINYVNPNISNQTALQLAQRVNALTLNSYKSTDKIETTELDSIIPKGERPIGTGGPAMLYNEGGNKYFNLSTNPQVSVPKSQLPLQNDCFTIQLYAQTPLDSMMQIIDLTATGSWQVTNYQYQNPISTSTAHQWRLVIQGPNATDTDVVSFIIHFDETDQYAAYNLPVTVTITEG